MDPQLENPAPEVPPANEVPPGNPPPPAPAPQGAPPPAATLATQGEVTDERALEIARREAALEEANKKLRDDQIAIAEQQKRLQDREEALRNPVTTAATKRKRNRNWTDPVNAPEEIELD